MDGIHAQGLQVVDGPGFGERQELTRILRPLSGNRKITVVHLIDHQVGRTLRHRTAVTHPPHGIGLLQVDDGATPAIHAYGLGKHTGTLALADIEGIELPHQVALHRDAPEVIADLRQVKRLPGLALQSFLIEAQTYLFGIAGGKELKRCRLRGVAYLIEGKVLGLCGHCRHHQE